MNDQTQEKYRQLLLHLQKELLDLKLASKESTQTVDLDQSSVGRLSRMDAMQSQAMAKENSRRREQQLVRIDAALERIEEDEYGYCASCDEEINRRRLDVDPANPFCVDCASKL
ncbi:MAG: TraR/DksA family transcriptional regulator [Desulforhopalus sp.]